MEQEALRERRPRRLDRRDTLYPQKVCSLFHARPILKISWKSIIAFGLSVMLSTVKQSQTASQTEQQSGKYILMHLQTFHYIRI